MNFKRDLRILVLVTLLAMATSIAFAEEIAVTTNLDSTADVSISQSSMPPAALEKEGDSQWVWGEVVSLDSQAKTITLKYLDYETDQEKELVLIVDNRTAYENVKSFDEIKVKDTLSVDYAVESESKNNAKNISLEKPEGVSSAPAQVDSLKSADLPSVADAEQATANIVQPAAATEILEPVPVPALIEAEKDTQEAPVVVTGTTESAPATQGQAQ